MLGAWIQYLFWRPLETAFRRVPLVALRAHVTAPVPDVICIRIDNVVTRAISRLGGGYDYSVIYIVDRSLVVDTGFPWARRCLEETLKHLGIEKNATTVVNTHHHEDHVGNNDLFAEARAIYAHPQALSDIRYPSQRPWYRRFMFGPTPSSRAQAIPSQVRTDQYVFDVVHLPGHSPDHVCMYEPKQGWLFSGDLYIAADIDCQLQEVNGPAWICSLEKGLALHPRVLFDAHGLVLTGATEIADYLKRKRDFLVALRERVQEARAKSHSLPEITARVFDKRSLVNYVSFSDGWLALLSGSDMSRTHLIRSFLDEMDIG